jgi:hypothetical protein
MRQLAIIFGISALLMSCGKEEKDYKSLQGTWKLNTISCLGSATSSDAEEIYADLSAVDVRFRISGRNFLYTVNGATCETGASGVYQVSFDDAKSGKISLVYFSNFSEGCDEPIIEEGIGLPVSVPMGILPSKAKNLRWIIAGNQLNVGFMSGFGGDGGATGSDCGTGSCFCVGTFNK